MFIHKRTGTVFSNRKNAIILMGQNRYRRFLKDSEFEFIEDKSKKTYL